MKRKVKFNALILMMVFIFLLTACQQNQEIAQGDNNNPTDTSTIIDTKDGNVTVEGEDDEKLKEFLERSGGLETPTREYGREQIRNVNAGEFLAHTSYPEGGLGQLDQLCKDWVEEILETYRKESQTNGGELIVNYNSYIIDNQYVVVEFFGEYSNVNYAQPVKLFTTYNADITTGNVLTLHDILSEEQINKLTEYVIEDNNLAPENVDDELLNKWQCAKEGVEITLLQGKYLPSSESSRKVFASYDFLSGIAENKSSTKQELVSSEATEIAESTEANLSSKEQETSSAINGENDPAPTIDENAKYIALTFDDGPGDDTARLLDILKENGVKATFFILGSRIDSHPEVLPRMVEEGHQIAGHSWSHRSLTLLNDEQVTNEIMQTRAKIFAATNVDPIAVRPPYGAFNDRVKALGKELGVYFVNWNVDPEDWKTRNAQMTYDEIIKGAANGNIILSHDIHSSTVDAMSLVVPKLLSEGYTFVTVEELLKMGHEELEPGKVYFSMKTTG